MLAEDENRRVQAHMQGHARKQSFHVHNTELGGVAVFLLANAIQVVARVDAQHNNVQ